MADLDTATRTASAWLALVSQHDGVPMDLHSLLRFVAMAVCLDAAAQTAPIVNRAGYDWPAMVKVAPGQLITFFVTGIRTGTNRVPSGSDLETTLSGITVLMQQLTPQGAPVFRVPILEVRYTPTCANAVGTLCLPPMVAVTVQVPFELQHRYDLCLLCPGPSLPLFAVQLEGVGSYAIDGTSFPDQIRILRAFDSVLENTDANAVIRPCVRGNRFSSITPGNVTGLPCPPIVKHADGSLVSATNPAKAGEELVAYAVGLGQTSPDSETGKVVRTSAPTVQTFAIDFNYRRNALGTRPPPVGTPGVPAPLYTGSLEGSVGLYEVRFVVPPVPPGTEPCGSLENISGMPRDYNIVYSNLTFSVGGRFSFDGAGICVAVEEEDEDTKN